MPHASTPSKKWWKSDSFLRIGSFEHLFNEAIQNDKMCTVTWFLNGSATIVPVGFSSIYFELGKRPWNKPTSYEINQNITNMIWRREKKIENGTERQRHQTVNFNDGRNQAFGLLFKHIMYIKTVYFEMCLLQCIMGVGRKYFAAIDWWRVWAESWVM